MTSGGTYKPYIRPSLGPGVSRLFEHEKLARPSDSGHYVVATRLFHHRWAKLDVVLVERANFQNWLFKVEPPSGIVAAHKAVQLIEDSKEGKGSLKRLKAERKSRKTEALVVQKQNE